MDRRKQPTSETSFFTVTASKLRDVCGWGQQQIRESRWNVDMWGVSLSSIEDNVGGPNGCCSKESLGPGKIDPDLRFMQKLGREFFEHSHAMVNVILGGIYTRTNKRSTRRKGLQVN